MKKLYKFRSTNNFEFLADILVSERLYCSKIYELNDPMEGFYRFSTKTKLDNGYTVHFSGTENIQDKSIRESRICSLTSEVSDVRMWAHYAESQTGIAIELDFEGIENEPKKVIYDPSLLEVDCSDKKKANPEDVLIRKTVHWEYEAEYRIITEKMFFDIKGRIKRVILGRRCPESMEPILKKLVPTGCNLARLSLNASKQTLTPRDIT